MAVQPATELPLQRLDLDVYDRLVQAAALDEEVEFRDGLLVERDAEGAHRLHRFDVASYSRMAATGALDELPIELLDGLLVQVSPETAGHVLVVGRLTRHFIEGADWWVQSQSSFVPTSDSAPKPDLLVSAHEPRGRLLETALLAVEVAVTSQRVDRGRKVSLYAEAGIPAYWLVDVPRRMIEVRTDPRGDGYERCAVYTEGAVVPSPLAGVAGLDVSWLLAGVEE